MCGGGGGGGRGGERRREIGESLNISMHMKVGYI